jgi:hypothetical protein
MIAPADFGCQQLDCLWKVFDSFLPVALQLPSTRCEGNSSVRHSTCRIDSQEPLPAQHRKWFVGPQPVQKCPIAFGQMLMRLPGRRVDCCLRCRALLSLTPTKVFRFFVSHRTLRGFDIRPRLHANCALMSER